MKRGYMDKLNNKYFHAIFTSLSLFLILYFLIIIFNLMAFLGIIPIILTIVISLLTFFHLIFLNHSKPLKIFLLPLSNFFVSYIIFLFIKLFDHRLYNYETDLVTWLIILFSFLSLIISFIIFLEIKFKRFKIVMYAILFMIIILMFLFFLYLDVNVDKINYCLDDSDCIAVQAGCVSCGCAGGSNIAINERYLDRYQRAIYFRCSGIMWCLTKMSLDLTCYSPPKCVNNKCIIDTDDMSLCKSDSCYYNFATQKLNASICKKISGEGSYSVEQCIDNIIRLTGNLELCNEHPLGEEECFLIYNSWTITP